MYDLIIVGAGPAGIFTALELIKKGSKASILLVEKGKAVEKRHCPKAEVGHCVNCKPTCAITTGFSGAGAFSDGKLSLCYEVGGSLPELIGEETPSTWNSGLTLILRVWTAGRNTARSGSGPSRPA